MIRVLIYDKDGKLLCWYTATNKKDVEAFCGGLPDVLTWSLEYVV